jgi:tetratricopeptide (TPR) repeat protein
LAAFIIGLPGGDLDGGIAIIDRALSDNATWNETPQMSGLLRAYAGDTKTAHSYLQEANRLRPPGASTLADGPFGFCLICFVDGDYERVLDWTAEDLRTVPNDIVAWRYRIAALGLLGRLDEARRAVDRVLAINPDLTISLCRRFVEVVMKNPFKRPGVAEAYYEGLRLAGLPE